MITEVVPNFYRGSRPKDLNDFRDLVIDHKIKTIINLEKGWFECIHGKMDEESEWAAKTRGVKRIFHVPLSDVFVPSAFAVKLIHSLVQLSVKHDEAVYLHCEHGKDRTGYVCAAYRILQQDWNVNAALNEMFDLGFHYIPYLYWVPSLKRGLK